MDQDVEANLLLQPDDLLDLGLDLLGVALLRNPAESTVVSTLRREGWFPFISDHVCPLRSCYGSELSI